jgi:nicotinate-nucleotide pyrophosphorylase (carboxylating)
MQNSIKTMVKEALREDVESGDITSELLDNSLILQAKIIARESGVLCGCSWVEETFHQLNSDINCTWMLKEGERFKPNQMVAKLKGPIQDLLTGERMALNWLQTLSGTATITASYVAALTNTQTQLLDTRKTIPGLRMAQKYAVRCGGGTNHRMGLFDAFLIKENHIEAFGSIERVIKAARALDPKKTLEIEVENLQMLNEALNAKPDIILLDNFNIERLKKAVKLNKTGIKLEVSGNITLENLSAIAKTGVDYISVGSITKNLKAIDFSLLIQ